MPNTKEAKKQPGDEGDPEFCFPKED